MKKTIFIVLLLFSIHFWGIKYVPQKFNAENLISWLVMGICFFKVIHKKELHFRNAIILFLIGIFVNILSAYINQGQSPYDTFLSFGYYYFILFYFVLHDLQLSRKYLENIIIIFAILYSLVYIIQVLVYPLPLVSGGMDESRGTIRLRIAGNGFLVLAYFLMLNRFLLKRNLIYILTALAFFIILLMGGFRTLTLGALLLSGFMFIKLVKFNIKNYALLVFVVLLFMGLLQFKGISNIYNGMVGSTDELIKQGDKYIRVVQLDFFFNKFPKNISVYFLGSGLPGGKSAYYLSMLSYSVNLGIYWVDLGLIGFYIIIGPLALAGLLWYTIKAILFKIPKDKLYLNFYFAYLLIVSITTMEIFREGIFAVHAIGLYLIDEGVGESSILSECNIPMET